MTTETELAGGRPMARPAVLGVLVLAVVAAAASPAGAADDAGCGSTTTRGLLFGGMRTKGGRVNLDRNHDGRINAVRENSNIPFSHGHHNLYGYYRLIRYVDQKPRGNHDGYVSKREINRWVRRRFDSNHDGRLNCTEKKRLDHFVAPFIFVVPVD
jgi:hypothetical protein